MYTLHTNVHMTRRKHLCFVLDESDTVLWSGQSVGGALQYLIEVGQVEFILDGPNPEERFVVNIRRI